MASVMPDGSRSAIMRPFSVSSGKTSSGRRRGLSIRKRKYSSHDKLCPVLAVIATEIAVLAASSSDADKWIVQAVNVELGSRVAREPATAGRAVRTQEF